MLREDDERRNHPARGGPILKAAVMLCLGMIAWWSVAAWYEQRVLADQRTRTESELIPYGNALTTAMNERLALLEGLSAFARANPSDLDLRTRFDSFAGGLYAGKAGLRVIQLFPAQGPVLVYPLKGNEEVTGRTLRHLLDDERPEVNADVRKAIRSRRIALSGPYELRQGGLGLVARLAIHRGEAVWGMAVLVFDLPPILRLAGLDPAPRSLDTSLRDDRGRIVAGHGAMPDAVPVAAYTVSLPDRAWRLTAIPRGGWGLAHARELRIFRGAGLLVVLLLTALVYVRADQRARLRHLVAVRTAALRESEERYGALFENSPDAVLLTAPDGRILSANPAACRMFGRPEAELQAAGRAAVVDMADPRLPGALQERARAGRFQGELTFRRADGSLFPGEVSSTVFEDRLGEQRTSMIIRDITDRKEAEEAVRRAHERLRQFVDANLVGVVVASPSGGVIDANDYYLRLIGYTREEFEQGQVDWRAITPPEWLPADEQAIEELRTRGICTPYEKEYIRRDGSRVSVFLSDAMLPGPEEQIAAFILDITERKRAEAATKREHDFSEAVLDSLPGVLYCYNEDLQFRRWNRNFERATGYTASEVARLSPLDLFSGTDRELLARRIREVFDKGASEVEADFVAKDGTRTPYFFTGRAVEIEGERHLVGVGIDVTARRLAEAATRASEARLEFALHTSHTGGWDLDLVDHTAHRTLEHDRIFGYDSLLPVWTYEMFLDHVLPEDRPEVDRRFREATATRTDWSFECRIRRRDGAVRWIWAAGGHQRDGMGRARRMAGIVQDITERKQVEAALHESEALLRIAGHMARLGGWLVDLDENRVTWSDEVAAIHELPAGYSPTLEEGLNFYAAEWREKIARVFGACAREGVPYDEEMVIVTARGTRVWVRTIGEALRDATGRIAKVQGAFQDITEQKRAEAEREHLLALEQSARVAADAAKEHLTQVMERISDGFGSLDRDWRYTFVNERLAQMVGRRREDLLGRHIWTEFPEAIGTPVYEAYRSAMDEQKRIDLKHYYPPFGRWFQHRFYPSAEGLSVFSHDITEEKRAEEEQARWTQQLEVLRDVGEEVSRELNLSTALSLIVGRAVELLGGASGIVALWDDQTRRLSPGALHGLGAWAQDLCWQEGEGIIGRVAQARAGMIVNDYRASSFAHPPALARTQVTAVLAEPLVSRGKLVGVLTVNKEAGGRFCEDDRRILSLFASQAAVAIENAQLYEGSRRDAATLEQRVAERTAELAAVNKELETFTYSVSHDLKAPLRGIDGYSRLLLHEHAERLNDEGRSFLHTIRKAVAQMSRLIDDLLAYSRLERRALHVGQVNARALIDKLLAERSDELRARTVTTRVELPFETVTAEAEGLAQAIRNLLDNALKFTQGVAAPAIDIGGRETERTRILWVRDNGIGFDMRYHERLYGIFQRLHRAEDYPGTGVGLAIVKKAVERMGGQVWAESVPGQGATFYVEVPR